MISRIIRFSYLFSATCLVFLVGGQAFAGGLYERDFDDADFSNSTTIDNPYWPLVPGMEFTYFADSRGNRTGAKYE